MKYSTHRNSETLAKNPSDSVVAGVCSGLARHLGLPTVLVRILAVILLVSCTKITAIGYLLCALILPSRRY